MTIELQELAATLPDNQLLLDIRGSLLSRPCELFGLRRESFVIRRFDTPLICVVGKPAISAIKEAVSKSVAEVEVLTCRESVVHVSSALSDWQEEAALIHEFQIRRK